MNQLQKIAIAFVMAVVSFGASAANPAKGIYENDGIGMVQCLADMKAGTAKPYTPTTKNPLTDKTFEVKKMGKGGACLSGAYVREDKDAKVTRGVVYVAEGFAYGEQKTASGTSYRMAACSNPFDGINVPPEKVAEMPTVVQGTTTLVVNKIIERNEVTVETTIAHVEVCKDSTARPKQNPATGKLECPAVEVHLPITVIPDLKVAPNIVMAPVKVDVPIQPQVKAQAKTDDCTDCTPLRKTEVGKGGNCRFAVPGNRSSIECNFVWRVLKTQDQIANCGCQLIVPSTKQIIGFMDAMPGSPRCLQQKKIWTEALGLRYDDNRPPQ